MFKDPQLAPVWEKARDGRRVTSEEALRLFHTGDLLGLGRIADFLKERRAGRRVTYVLNRQINPTNLCVLSCRFCDFASKKNRPNAYAMTLEEVLSKCTPDLKEVHIVGGLNHEWPFERYVDIVRVIHEKYPSLQIKAY